MQGGASDYRPTSDRWCSAPSFTRISAIYPNLAPARSVDAWHGYGIAMLVSSVRLSDTQAIPEPPPDCGDLAQAGSSIQKISGATRLTTSQVTIGKQKR